MVGHHTENVESAPSLSDIKGEGEIPAKPVGLKANLWWAGVKLLAAVDYVGEVFADFFGLNNSKYQYVVDAYDRYQYELASEKAHEAFVEPGNEAKVSEVPSSQAPTVPANVPHNHGHTHEEHAQLAAHMYELGGSIPASDRAVRAVQVSTHDGEAVVDPPVFGPFGAPRSPAISTIENMLSPGPGRDRALHEEASQPAPLA